MRVLYCDVCKEVVTLNQKKSIMLIHTSVEHEYESSPEDMLIDIVRQHEKGYSNFDLYELCPSCINTVKHVLKLRKSELDKVKKEIENIVIITKENRKNGEKI